MFPNLVIIGAMKCATTSLHYYLSLHPEVEMSREKELNFFIAERNWPRGRGWYESFFTEDAAVHGEASPNYTCYPLFRGVPERMGAVIPDAKLIYVVRDPVERIVSHYWHRVAVGQERRPVEEALGDVSAAYVPRSRYYFQLERYLAHFPPSRILVVVQEELAARRRETLREVFGFLGVDDSFDTRRFAREMHRSGHKRRKTRLGQWVARAGGDRVLQRVPYRLRGYAEKVFYFPLSRPMERPQLPVLVRARLREELRDDAERLRAHVGREFPAWSV
jgi:sulfotransferase family protein